jgi:hypothetical protein
MSILEAAEVDITTGGKMQPRIILHAGTPKTGTTSLQHYLRSNREALLARGISYPLHGTDEEPGQPKHQWFVRGLVASNSAALMRDMKRALGETSRPIDTFILSAEGLFNHWWDFSRSGRRALAALAAEYPVELWVWFRDPAAFVGSNYVQVLKNAPNRRIRCYGRDLPPETILADAWFARHLDYAGFVRDVERVLGAGSARLFAYAGDTVDSFCGALRMSGLPPPPKRYNASLGAEAVALLRVLNGTGLGQGRALVVDRLARMSAQLGDRPFSLPSRVVDRIEEMSAPSLLALKREFGFDLHHAGHGHRGAP